MPVTNSMIFDAIQALQYQINALQIKIGNLIVTVSQDQGDVNNAVTVITGLLTDLGTQDATIVTDVQQVITDLANGQPVSTDALDAIVAKVQSVQTQTDTAVSSLTTAANPTPPTTPAT